MLSRLVIAFLPRNKHLLISWLQLISAVIFGAQEKKVSHCFHCCLIYLPWSDGTECHDLSTIFLIILGLFSFSFKKKFFFLLYNIVLVLPYINMHLPRVYTCSPSWTPLPPPSPIPSLQIVPVHQPQASCILHRTWTGDSFLIWYYTCFNAILPNHPTLTLSHRVQKTVLYISVSSAVSYTGLLLPSF